MSQAHEKYIELQRLRNTNPAEIDPERTALMVIDMQNYFLSPQSPLSQACEAQVPGVLASYHARGRDVVEPTLSRLLTFFRARRMRIIYTTVASELADGTDLSPVFRQRNQSAREMQLPPYIPAKSDTWAQVVPALEPQEDEVVVNKTTYGAFSSTGLEAMLRNMGISTLVIGGVVTNVCVETTARDACDRGFDVVLVDDACAAFSPEAHDATMLALQGPFATVCNADDVIALLDPQVD
jgi:nicotinamidase-related amidase